MPARESTDLKVVRREPHPPYWGMPSMQVITSSLSLARELWRLGEPELAGRALDLSPDQVADIGQRAGQLHTSGEAGRLWPGGPGGKAVLLAVIEQLEGRARPCARNRRLPEKSLPEELQASEDERLAAAGKVAQIVTRRNAGIP